MHSVLLLLFFFKGSPPTTGQDIEARGLDPAARRSVELQHKPMLWSLRRHCRSWRGGWKRRGLSGAKAGDFGVVNVLGIYFVHETPCPARELKDSTRR